MNMHTYRPPCDKSTMEDLYVVRGKTQMEIARLLGCSLKPVQTAMKRFGVVPRRAIKRDQKVPSNSSWKGETAGYQAMHLRVRTVRGKPNACEKCGTKVGRFEWANLTGKYSDPNDYKSLCISCHRKMDQAHRNFHAQSR